MAKARKKRRIDRFTVINAILVVFGTAGALVMVVALGITISGLITHHSYSGMIAPTPSTTPSMSEPAIIESTRTYTFDSTKDLAAFKQAGKGKVTITKGHRMQIKTVEAGYKSMTLTVHVDGQSTVSFDDQVSSEQNYDFGTFLIDGKVITNASGIASGTAKFQTYPLAYGTHTLTWRYTKDYDMDKNADSYYVDNIKVTHQFTDAAVKEGW